MQLPVDMIEVESLRTLTTDAATSVPVDMIEVESLRTLTTDEATCRHDRSGVSQDTHHRCSYLST
jgi:hypothetical protein